MIANPRELNQAVTFLHENGMYVCTYVYVLIPDWIAGRGGGPLWVCEYVYVRTYVRTDAAVRSVPMLNDTFSHLPGGVFVRGVRVCVLDVPTLHYNKCSTH